MTRMFIITITTNPNKGAHQRISKLRNTNLEI